ncbi:MAG TPA: AbrB/MazE/SpoVT family DNA-binding domain-containing protein [Planctomycetota bacterium]|nr:AbrB/MazE/SpoVT family DNA-binding domain-containing protein [Planctomycetota bacterium]
MTTSRMNSNGQVVIPAPIRKLLGLRKGTPLLIREERGAIILQPATRQYFDSLAGILAGGPSMSRELTEEHAREREREGA